MFSVILLLSTENKTIRNETGTEQFHNLKMSQTRVLWIFGAYTDVHKKSLAFEQRMEWQAIKSHTHVHHFCKCKVLFNTRILLLMCAVCVCVHCWAFILGMWHSVQNIIRLNRFTKSVFFLVRITNIQLNELIWHKTVPTFRCVYIFFCVKSKTTPSV